MHPLLVVSDQLADAPPDLDGDAKFESVIFEVGMQQQALDKPSVLWKRPWRHRVLLRSLNTSIFLLPESSQPPYPSRYNSTV
jgi:hypothetical protein